MYSLQLYDSFGDSMKFNDTKWCIFSTIFVSKPLLVTYRSYGIYCHEA